MIYQQALTLLTLAASASALAITRRADAAQPAPTWQPICGPNSTPTLCVPGNHAKQPASFGAAISMPVAPGPDLGFVVLSSTGVSNVPKISINGNVGVAPAAETYITAFALIDEGNYAKSYEVNSNGKVYGADTAGSQTPLAVQYMVTAYNDAAQLTADYSECGAGTLDSYVLKSGVYSWSTAVSLSLGASLTLQGGPTDYFILQAAGAFSLLGNIFLDGVKPDQVFWVGATSLTVGDHARFAGVALTYTNIVIADFAQVYGRLWTQTEVAFAAGSVVYAPTFESGVPDAQTPLRPTNSIPLAVPVYDEGLALVAVQKVLAADIKAGASQDVIAADTKAVAISLADYNVVQAARLVTAAAQLAATAAATAKNALATTASDSAKQAASDLVTSTGNALVTAQAAQDAALTKAKNDAPSSTSYTTTN